jgi:hypothetical protein
MAPNYIDALESLSAYKFVSSLGEDSPGPVALSHYRMRIGGRIMNVLSRVAPHGVDHTLRINKIAHHLVLPPDKLPPGGPAWLLEQEGVMITRWKIDSEPRYLEVRQDVPQGDIEMKPAKQWEYVTGDAGWAGVLAQHFLDFPDKPVYIIYPAGMETLPLIREATMLLAPECRWKVTFNTYFNRLPFGESCLWRCCFEGSDALKEVRRTPNLLVIDLTSKLGAPAPGPLVEAARTGIAPKPSLRVPAAPSTKAEAITKLEQLKKPQPVVPAEVPTTPTPEIEEIPARKSPRLRPLTTRPQTARPRVSYLAYAAVIILGILLAISVGLYLDSQTRIADLETQVAKFQDKSSAEGQAKKLQQELGKKNNELDQMQKKNAELEADLKKTKGELERVLKEKDNELAELRKKKEKPETPEAKEATSTAAKVVVGQEIPPQDSPRDIREPSQGKTHYYAMLGKLEEVIKELKDKPEYSLEVKGAQPGYSKVELFWEGTTPRQVKCEKMQLKGEGATGGADLLLISFSTKQDEVCFERGRDAKPDQIDQLEFDRVWKIVLTKTEGGDRIVIFTKTRSFGEAKISVEKDSEKESDKRVCNGSINIDSDVPHDAEILFDKQQPIAGKWYETKKFRIQAERHNSRVTFKVEILKEGFDEEFRKFKGEKLDEKIKQAKEKCGAAEKMVGEKNIKPEDRVAKIKAIYDFINDFVKQVVQKKYCSELYDNVEKGAGAWDKLGQEQQGEQVLKYIIEEVKKTSRPQPLPGGMVPPADPEKWWREQKEEGQCMHILKFIVQELEKEWERGSREYFADKYYRDVEVEKEIEKSVEVQYEKKTIGRISICWGN